MRKPAPVAWLQGRPEIVKLALLAAAGAAAALGFAPYYALPLMFLAFPLLLLMTGKAASSGQAARLGWCFGFGHFLVGFSWIGNAFLVDAKTFGWEEYPALLMLAGVMALYPAVAMVATHALWRRLGAAKGDGLTVRGVLAFALCWSAAEWLRGHLFTGFPWNLVGYMWGFSDAMLQPAALFGIYGLSLLTAVILGLPVVWVSHPLRSREGFKGFLVITLMPLLMLGFGLWSLATARTGHVPGVHLRIIQANIPQSDKWDPAQHIAQLKRYLELSRTPAAVPPTDIIWPETAMPYFVGSDPRARAVIASVIATPDGHVITGAPRIEHFDDGGVKLWNSLFVIGQDGNVDASYDKVHLVPFGEYLPLRKYLSLIGLDKLAAGDVDFSPGGGPKTLTVSGLPPVSPLICYEIIFPGRVTAPGPRPQWILNITNDGWFGKSQGPYQHLVAARTRAIEEGLPVVRAAGTGISAFIDSRGRVLSSIPLDQEGILDGNLPEMRATRPLYARLGDWSYLFLIGICTFVMLGGWRSARNADKSI